MAEHTWADLVAAHERTRLASDSVLEHAPRAAILCCSDARVPPSVVFDQPAGSLFVVRIAGNTATAAALASLDYAVEHLGVDLVIVLGHSGCGAVAAAAAGTCGGHLSPIVAPICRLAEEHPDATAERIVELNVDAALQTVLDHGGPCGRAARAGTLEVRGAVHELSTGALLERPASSVQPRTPMETR